LENQKSRRNWNTFTLVSPNTRESLNRAARLLDELGSIEALPQVVHRALNCMADSGSSSGELAAVLNTDQVIAGRLLGMANSVYFRGIRRFTTIREAIVRLGYRQVRELLLAAAFSVSYRRALPLYQTTGDELWHHSLATAVAADIVARTTRMDEPDTSYLAGLLHDAGRMAVARGLLSSQSQTITSMVKDDHCSFQQAEYELLGFSHAEVGAVLLDHWKVDDRLIAAVGSHHREPAEAGTLSWIVHVADVLAVTAGFPSPRGGWDYHVDEKVAERIDFQRWLTQDSPDTFEQLLQQIRQGVQEAFDLIEK
jgi:putative nucleotidyltransferase with HDIG domain